MKMKSYLNAAFVIAILFSFTSCGGKKEDAAVKEEPKHETSSHVPEATTGPQFQVDANFQQQLSDLFSAYVKLKDAFVATDVNKVIEESKAVSQAFGAIDMKLLSGAAHNDWMTFSAEIESSLKEIAASSDIEVQRTSFSKLSDNMYKSIKAYGLGGATAYYEYCPMAFNNQGAYWLSDQSVVMNPYFGNKMLRCGRVEETLK